MDKLTDILTTFFVTNTTRGKKQVMSQQQPRQQPEQPEQPEQSEKQEKQEKPEQSEKQKQTKTKSDTSGTSSSSSSRSSTSSSYSSDTSDDSSSKSKTTTVSDSSVGEDPVLQEDHVLEKELSVYSDLSSLRENVEGEQQEGEQHEGEQHEGEQHEEEQHEGEQHEEEQQEQLVEEHKGSLIKKYILKPSEFYKKNIAIVTDSRGVGIDILSDLLYKLSLIKDVGDIYSNRVNIFSNSSNKKLYKQMLLDNPYLYFTDFDVKTSVTKRKLSDLDTETKRVIYIFDNDIVNNDIVAGLVDKNVQIIVLSSDEDSGHNMYNALGTNRLLLYKPSKLKMIQKRFYKNYIRPLTTTSTNDFEEYYKITNNDELDVKYIVLKETELRFN